MESKGMRRAVFGAVGAAAMLLAGAAQAAGVPGQGTWETTLQARDLNGDSVTDTFYDTALNITWLRQPLLDPSYELEHRQWLGQ